MPLQNKFIYDISYIFQITVLFIHTHINQLILPVKVKILNKNKKWCILFENIYNTCIMIQGRNEEFQTYVYVAFIVVLLN